MKLVYPDKFLNFNYKLFYKNYKSLFSNMLARCDCQDLFCMRFQYFSEKEIFNVLFWMNFIIHG